MSGMAIVGTVALVLFIALNVLYGYLRGDERVSRRRADALAQWEEMKRAAYWQARAELSRSGWVALPPPPGNTHRQR